MQHPELTIFLVPFAYLRSAGYEANCGTVTSLESPWEEGPLPMTITAMTHFGVPSLHEDTTCEDR